MANERLEVYNGGLILAGIEPMSHYNDQSLSVYTMVANEFNSQFIVTLREVPWNFARKKVDLQAVQGQPQGTYQKPGDYIRMWWEDALPGRPVPPKPFQEVGPYLCSTRQLDRARLDYIRQITFDEAPPQFLSILKLRLARLASISHSSVPRQQSIERMLNQQQESCYAIERADSKQQPPNFVEVGRGIYYGSSQDVISEPRLQYLR